MALDEKEIRDDEPDTAQNRHRIRTRQLGPFELAPGQRVNASRSMIDATLAQVERLARLAEEQEELDAKAQRAPKDTGKEITEENETPAPLPRPSLSDRVFAELLVKLSREPTDWAPRTVTVGATSFVQLVGRRPFRHTVAILNCSAAVNLYRSEDAAINGDTTQAIQIGGANQPSTLSIDMEGPIYASGIAEGATISVIESFWDPIKVMDSLQTLLRGIQEGKVEQVI